MSKKKRKHNPVLEYIRRMSRILFAIEYLGRYCEVCGLDGFEAPWLLDFHHRDQSTKKYEVKNKLYGGSFANHKEEIDKCMLICVSCHRNEHAKVDKYKENKESIFSKLDEIRKIGTGKITKNHSLTEEEKTKILEMIDAGLIMSEIAEQLCLNYCTIKYFVKSNKLDPKRKTRLKISGTAVIRLLNSKYSIRGIAQKLYFNRETIRQFIIKYIECEELGNGVKRYKIKEGTKDYYL